GDGGRAERRGRDGRRHGRRGRSRDGGLRVRRGTRRPPPGRPGVARRLGPEEAAHPDDELREVVRVGPPLVQVREVDPAVESDVLVVLLDGHAGHRPYEHGGTPGRVRRGEVQVDGEVVRDASVGVRYRPPEEEDGRRRRAVVEDERLGRRAEVRPEGGAEERSGVPEDALGVAVDAREAVHERAQCRVRHGLSLRGESISVVPSRSAACCPRLLSDTPLLVRSWAKHRSLVPGHFCLLGSGRASACVRALDPRVLAPLARSERDPRPALGSAKSRLVVQARTTQAGSVYGRRV
ncbi:hypothetical protein THAOC_18286, partial [Thalassiosira oceanica]